MSDDTPETWRELAEAAVADLRNYAFDEGPERRMVSVRAYEPICERLALEQPRASRPVREGEWGTTAKMAELLTRAVNIIDVTKQEWSAVNSWSDWDQKVRTDITAALAEHYEGQKIDLFPSRPVSFSDEDVERGAK